MATVLQASYDAFPYESFPFPQSHPDRLATIGWLFGLTPAEVGRARVLEIGCAAGGNIIPLAASLSGAECVGIDFSQVQIDAGRQDVATLGLLNIRLLHTDIAAFDASLGTFDYIIAHGVYSWVPNDVQEKILGICERQLNPGGIAYISYNTLPGWGMRGVVRAAMRYHTQQFTDPRSRVTQARAMLDFLAESAQDDPSAYGVMLRTEALEVRSKPDYYVLHDHLEEVNEPLYFHQFMERAARHGLRYLGEANFQQMFLHGLPSPVAQTLSRIAPDLMKREQFMDFLRNRTFRQTLLVKDEVTLERKVSPLRLMSLHAASRARPTHEDLDVRVDGFEEFRTPDGNGISTSRPLGKAALLALAEHWPASMPFDALSDAAAERAGLAQAAIEERNALASTLLSAFAAGVIELQFAKPPFVVEPGPFPEAGAWPRLQTVRGSWVTTLRHEPITVDDVTRRLLPLLDGKHSREAIAESLWPTLPLAQGLSLLQEALPQLGRQALLVG